MATSGTITGSFSGNQNLSFLVKWTLQSQDPATLKSTVKFQWIARRKYTATGTFKDGAAWSQKVAGTSSSGTVDFDIRNTAANADYVWRTSTSVIKHNADGTKTASVSCSLNLEGTSAGTGSLSGTITLPTIAVNPPTANSLSFTDESPAYENVHEYVGGFAMLQLTATATAGDGAIASYKFYRDATLMGTVTTDLESATLTMATAEPAGTFVYSVVVTDVYGLTATLALSPVTMLAYTMPTITADTYRNANSGTPPAYDNDGTYGYCEMSWTVAAIGSGAYANDAVVHKVTFDGNDQTLTSGTGHNFSGLSISSSYSAVYIVTDKIGGTATITQTIPVSYINFDLYPSSSGGGAAFGEAAQNDKFIVNHSESIFRGDVTAGDYDMTLITSTNAVSISTSGITIEEQEVVRFGRVATMMLRISGTIAAGGSVSGSIASGWIPAIRSTGAGYYSQTPFIMQIADDGGLTIRNASASSRTPTSASPLTVAVTYILA